MPPDEGPYFQSAQGPAHQAAIEALWESGALYACDCSREEIDERTKLRAAAGDPTPGYDGHCRDRGLPRGEGRALRFRTPDEGVTTVSDLVRGEVEFPNRATEDFICVKGNGKPLFALANVVDDRTMAITARLPGRGAPAQHAQADHAVAGAQRGHRLGVAATRLRPPAPAGQRAGQEALQAS